MSSAGSFAAVPPRYGMPGARNGPPGPGGMPPAGFPGGAPPHMFAGGDQMRSLSAQRLPPNAGPMRMPTVIFYMAFFLYLRQLFTGGLV